MGAGDIITSRGWLIFRPHGLGNHGKTPPHARGYKIRIDKDYKTVHVPEMTGRQILGLVNKTPEKYLLSQKFHGGQVVPIAADEVVDFRRHGIERFQTLALDPTEGGWRASHVPF